MAVTPLKGGAQGESRYHGREPICILFRLAEKSDVHRTECDKETNSSDVTSEYRVPAVAGLRGSLLR